MGLGGQGGGRAGGAERGVLGGRVGPDRAGREGAEG